MEVTQRMNIDNGLSILVMVECNDNQLKGKLLNEWMINLDQRWVDVSHIDCEGVDADSNSFFRQLWHHLPQKGKILLIDCSWEEIFNKKANNLLQKEVFIQKLKHIENYLKDEGVMVVKAIVDKKSNDDAAILLESGDMKRMYEGFASSLIQKVEQFSLAYLNTKQTQERYPVLSKVIEEKMNAQIEIDEDYHVVLNDVAKELSNVAERLRNRQKSLVILFEGMDGSGKGSCIQAVAYCLDPRWYKVYPRVWLKDLPKGYPQLHDYWEMVPSQGHVSILDRSWYNWLLDKRVHNECDEIESLKMLKNIRMLEEQMAIDGCILIKFWLDISDQEQEARIHIREKDPAVKEQSLKEDWENHKKWALYKQYAEIMMNETATPSAPWIKVNANSIKLAKAKVMSTIIQQLKMNE